MQKKDYHLCLQEAHFLTRLTRKLPLIFISAHCLNAVNGQRYQLFRHFMSLETILFYRNTCFRHRKKKKLTSILPNSPMFCLLFIQGPVGQLTPCPSPTTGMDLPHTQTKGKPINFVLNGLKDILEPHPKVIYLYLHSRIFHP